MVEPEPFLTRVIFLVGPPSEITKPKAFGLPEPLMVRVSLNKPVFVIEPPPATVVKDEISWLYPFKSNIPPVPVRYPMVTSVLVGRALFTPNFIVAVVLELKIVAPL